ncbi:flavin reductase family protein [Mucilaginibacter sp. L3T2-6]|uniref:flavin reductase family protein n=1 Tax=Mucilaginibacter sp. L3T2-6 TaxID=3062491 RepID=UPI0026750DAE|nr:flavin reductase family protein [Mucilaginibacter sp. L3T2-6]MDO3644295.1 flavin reductase family protein [Mucilaginibacter sp. L3T2-6]MDV6216746.1 flavin reductase family protein [Mucilaginibacter sp. L3T2-6]
MLTLKTSELSPVEVQSVLNCAVAPRPICFASTVDREGNVNLSPFSYFNVFSVNPPICVFSPSRRVRDNTTKHTLENIREVPECVINIVNYNMVHQASLASVEYPKGTNEFIKAGFTMLPSEMVKPPRVAESPVQLECLVKHITPLGDGAGAGNLVVAEVKLIHVSESVLGDNGKIDQRKMDHVARLGGDWYCRVTNDNLFEVTKPVRSIGIGVDAIPFAIRNSKVLTGNNLGQLGNVEALPSLEQIAGYRSSWEIQELLNADDAEMQIHLKAKKLLDECKVMEAWMVLLAKK